MLRMSTMAIGGSLLADVTDMTIETVRVGSDAEIERRQYCFRKVIGNKWKSEGNQPTRLTICPWRLQVIQKEYVSHRSAVGPLQGPSPHQTVQLLEPGLGAAQCALTHTGAPWLSRQG